LKNKKLHLLFKTNYITQNVIFWDMTQYNRPVPQPPLKSQQYTLKKYSVPNQTTRNQNPENLNMKNIHLKYCTLNTELVYATQPAHPVMHHGIRVHA
jgi:hypothetical protein